ncbi:hypothetical protein AAG570_014141, partial [Ranatra chinensis]
FAILHYTLSKGFSVLCPFQLSSETVVKAFVNRIQDVNKDINAVVDDRFDEAIEEAKQVDSYLANNGMTPDQLEREKPFLGVPFTSKESSSAKGMLFTFGMASRRGTRASEDSEIVSRLKAGGGILVAVTNVPELNLWCETRNVNYGQTSNPYDTRRTVGGSSGGEAAILTACGSPMGLGTDIGGSIRMPAFYCGIFGHKPTGGLTPTRGMTFRTGNEGPTMVVAGPMVKYGEDIIPFLKLLVGADNLQHLNLDSKVDLKDVKMFYVTDPGDLRVSPVSEEMRMTMLKAVYHLSYVSSSPVEKVKIPGFRYCLSLWRHGMSKEPGNFAMDLGNRESEVSLTKEIPKLFLKTSQFTLPPILRLLDLKVLPPTDPVWAEQQTEKLKSDIIELLGNDGVLLFPSCPRVAPYHYTAFFRPYDFAYWAVFNALKLPVTQVPMGLSNNGLPLGLQIVSSPHNDHLTIAVAMELEKTFGGWVPPFTK